MMRCAVSIVAILVLAQPASSAPSTAPATQPATESLAGGMIQFAIPEGLELLGKRNDDLSASCAPADKSALLTLVVAPQGSTIEDQLGPKLAKLIIKTIEDQSAKGEIEILSPPKVQPDDRFLLRIRDRFRAKGKVGDRVQLYRGVGKFLVSMTATSFAEDEEQARKIHEQAEQMMLSVKLNRPGKPSASTRPAPPARPATFAKAKVRLTPPAGWIGETNENASGIIATYRDPQDRGNLIAVSVRPIPAEAKSDPKLRDALVDEIIAGERQAFVIDGSEPKGASQVISDRRFLRKRRTDYEAKGIRFRITSRQLRVGDVIVSVTMLALEEKAEEVDARADEVALSARGIGAAR